jgi:hypothetical protein
MKIRAGEKFYSAACGAAVIVVRAPGEEIDLACGDEAMTTDAPAVVANTEVKGDEAGTLIGKRYVDIESGIELLCIKSGKCSITVSGRPVTLKDAKPLPSSD